MGYDNPVNGVRKFLHVGTLLVAALFAACGGPSHLYGNIFVPAKKAPSIELVDQNGRAFSLTDERGKVVALYFGFTHCSDVCPATLALLGKAVRASGVASRTRIIFVSVDPKRDTPAALRAFIRRVGVTATGLSGTLAQLQPIWKAYGVSVEPHRSDIGHSDYIYYIDPSGRLRVLASTSESLAHLSENFRNLLTHS